LIEPDRGAVENLKSPLATRVELHEEIGSTQERARELAREGAPHGTLVISKVQTGGRGRLGRRWGSPPGGLWMSLVLRPSVSARVAVRTTQAAAVGVAKALRGFGVEARIKWPNDLLVDWRKICGILAEAGVPVVAQRLPPAAEQPLDFVILGVGLNANVDPQDLGVPEREVATLRSELGHDVDLLELLESLLSHLDAELARLEDFRAILGDWRALNCTLGNRVRVRRSGEVLEGIALDLGPEGELLLKTDAGIIGLFEGEVEQLSQERA
jgi:BirA family biotin operon repressor/biotin-[acetyl-CoA-carboxylase] ligase